MMSHFCIKLCAWRIIFCMVLIEACFTLLRLLSLKPLLCLLSLYYVWNVFIFLYMSAIHGVLYCHVRMGVSYVNTLSTPRPMGVLPALSYVNTLSTPRSMGALPVLWVLSYVNTLSTSRPMGAFPWQSHLCSDLSLGLWLRLKSFGFYKHFH